MRVSVLGVDLSKNVCSVVGLDASGAVVLRRRVKRETVIALAAKLSPCTVGNGSLRRRPPSRPGVRRSRARGAADVARICPALRQGAEERRSRRRRDRRRGEAPDDAVCRAEEQKPARPTDAPSIERPIGRRTNRPDQSVARDPSGARNRRPSGQAEAQAIPRRDDGRARRTGVEPRPSTFSLRRASTQHQNLPEAQSAWRTSFVRHVRIRSNPIRESRPRVALTGSWYKRREART